MKRICVIITILLAQACDSSTPPTIICLEITPKEVIHEEIWLEYHNVSINYLKKNVLRDITRVVYEKGEILFFGCHDIPKKLIIIRYKQFFDKYRGHYFCEDKRLRTLIDFKGVENEKIQ